MTEIAHRTVEANGIAIHLAEAGTGPVVLLCHGFPESWYSWRHQLKALAQAGYHAVAPDMRGYGETSQPEAIDQYTLFHLVGDMVGVLDALSAPEAVVVGHDWGAPVAWHCALFRPDRFRAVAGLSVPFRPRGSTRPTSVMPQTDSSLFYQLYFQAPGVAEAELERNPRDTTRRLLYSGSGDVPRRSDNTLGDQAPGMVPRTGGFLTRTVDPSALPAWLSEADIDVFAAEFVRTGFRGGLNWYRNIDRNWELLAPFAGARVTVPALYIAGDRDLVVKFPRMDRADCKPENFRPQPHEDDHAFRLRPLDATGARERGQRGPDRVSSRGGLAQPGIAAGSHVIPAQAGIQNLPKACVDARFRGHDKHSHGAPTLTTRKVRSSPSSSRRDTYSPILKAWSPKRKPSSSASALRPPFHSKAQVDPPGPPAR